MKKFEFVSVPVKRENAENYLLFSLLSFALSVTGTRFFLEITGYPQLGNSELHIAHVLWGGLFLFVAALLPLMYANRWVYSAGGIFSGLGVGLFIDEVGKFITQSNDYFYPPAAPIIYAFFLLVVLLYQRVRSRRAVDARAELYRVLGSLQDVLDHDLDPAERIELVNRLERVRAESETHNHTALAQTLLDFLRSSQLQVVPVRRGRWHYWQTWATAQSERWFTRRRLKAVLAASFLVLGLGALIELVLLLPQTPTSSQMALLLEANGQNANANRIFLYVMRVVMEGVAGLLLVAGSLLLLIRQDRKGVTVAYLGLLLALTVVDLLVFYFDQFSAALVASLQFLLLLALLHYRNRYLTLPLPAGVDRTPTALTHRPGERYEF